MFGFNNIDLKQTCFYQQAVSEGWQEGMSVGIEKGRVESEATLLLRLLVRCFGTLPVDIRQCIASANAEILPILGERVLEDKNLSEIFTEL